MAGPFNVPNGVKRGGQGQRRGLARGGQLEVAGVVVSSWVPNYGGPRGRGHMAGRGGGGMIAAQPMAAPQRNGHAHYPTRGGRAMRGGRRAGHQSTQRKTTTQSNSSTTQATTAAAPAPQSNGKSNVNESSSSSTK